MIETGEVFITTTAFLESGWVLRSAYGFSTGEIAAALRGLTGPPGVTVEKAQALRRRSIGAPAAWTSRTPCTW